MGLYEPKEDGAALAYVSRGRSVEEVVNASDRDINVSRWEARHPLEARHDPCSRWRYLFSKYLTPSASYRVTNTIKKMRTTVRINLCALGQLFYLYLGDFALAAPGYPS